MSLTLGLNTALSGLLTSQRGLDVIAQNVTNVNTVGYVRKVMSPESRVLAGRGAGVQEGNVTRMVNEGLLKDIRAQTSKLGQLEVEQTYHPRIEDLFGNVADDSSIAHEIQDLANAFEVLATEVNKPAVQWSSMQAGKDVTELMDRMSSGFQGLRLEADREIEQMVALINQELANIHDLNQKIVKNGAISTGVADLEDKRDVALTKLASFIDIEYYKRSDGGVIVYTKSGNQLIDNQPSSLTYSANTTIDSWMSYAGGHFDGIALGAEGEDITNALAGGKLKALVDLRDSTLPNMQAELDNIATRLKETINQVHNRGTTLPAVSSSYTGTRTFAKQGDILASPTGNPDTAATFYMGASTVTAAAGGATANGFGSLTFGAGNASYPWQATLTAAGGANQPFDATSFAAGQTFSLSGCEESRNDGTYRVVQRVSATQVIVEKVNVRQTIQLSGTEDVSLATFDSDGNQLQQTTLNTIMQTDFSALGYGPTTGDGRSSTDFTAKADHGDWSINEVGAHIQAWLRQQGYTSAIAQLNSDGKFVIDVKDATTSLTFRDQTTSTAGADSTDCTIAFDVNGDGATDETVSGFSNFLGLNDFFVLNGANSIIDSQIQASTYTTTVLREDFAIYDSTGRIGTSFDVPAGSSLSDIAALINKYTKTTESARQSSTSFTLTSDSTISISDGSSVLSTASFASGSTITLAQIAGTLTSGNVQASVIMDGEYSRLRVLDSSGKELTVSISGGALSNGLTLGTQLDMQPANRITASVVPEGSGERLRIVHSQNSDLYTSSTLDVQDQNLQSDLGLKRAVTRSSNLIDVRSDLQSGPEKISRGTTRWNSDLGEYYLSVGDNTTALQLGEAMSGKLRMDTAGGIYAGNYTLSEYAAASVSVSAQKMNASTDSYDYQKTLNASLDFQYTSYSGVNLDEEVAAMIDYQQAYTAAAKVITTLQEMLEVLTGMIR